MDFMKMSFKKYASEVSCLCMNIKDYEQKETIWLNNNKNNNNNNNIINIIININNDFR